MEFPKDNLHMQPGEESVFLVGVDKGEVAAVKEIGEIIVEEQGKEHWDKLVEQRRRQEEEKKQKMERKQQTPPKYQQFTRGKDVVIKHQAKKTKNELN